MIGGVEKGQPLCRNLEVFSQGAHTMCVRSRLLFYSKCTGFTVCFTYNDIWLSMYIKSMLNKGRITLPVVYCRPFASKAVF